MNILSIVLILLSCFINLLSGQSSHSKPRIIVSTDIGGTDPDDNQSMAHLLMYSDKFEIEGIVSSPSYGEGSTAEILRMIDLYEKDWPKLRSHYPDLMDPEDLRAVTKQGVRGNAPYRGFTNESEGSNWIIHCANKPSDQPLWILVWGGLEDVAQALHDDPTIQDKIRVYWIGGPNKKWSANSYAYIVENFPDLWFIENNASYYGFFSDNNDLDQVKSSNYYDAHIKGAGHLGEDFKQYYKGEIKMGDTPTILYLMHGDSEDPTGESWGGSFEPISRSARNIFYDLTSLQDTVAFCSIMEFQLAGEKRSIERDSICFYLVMPYGSSEQIWPGYYLGQGKYGVRYIPKKAEVLQYYIRSSLPEFSGRKGKVVIQNSWPGKENVVDYPLGKNWYSDKSDPILYDGKIQGGKTIQKWRTAVLLDWAERWKVLRSQP